MIYGYVITLTYNTMVLYRKCRNAVIAHVRAHGIIVVTALDLSKLSESMSCLFNTSLSSFNSGFSQTFETLVEKFSL